ncbi:MAG: sodium:alanine symporter family protein [Clostridia bacterium]|nr:sodium:alanine symporter family protein [Clostridia bacterium]
MLFLERTNSYLSGAVLPLVLISVGIYLAFKFRAFYIIHPIKTMKELKGAGSGDGVSPFKALSIALAGTLGVGNISGVATAICAGGAGAVFWMWASAFAAMSVKYAEVSLAVKYRRKKDGALQGGAFLYMREGLRGKIGNRPAALIASFFAVMLVLNSVLTGNIVQVNAASSVFEGIPPVVCGIAIALTVLAVTAGGAARIGDFTVRVIPFLTVLYSALSVFVIVTNADRAPEVFSRIVSGAFDFRAAAGGVVGFTFSRAVRFGVTRGIFSNEAGCGTAPTAHAQTNTDSPHRQGCLGIFEVFCDTIIMCTMTAFVILLADVPGYDGIPLSMRSYGEFCGRAGAYAVGISVIIFALATVICQEFYGMEALSFLGGGRGARRAYLAVSFFATLAGSVMSPGLVWQFADLEIAVMTVVNTLAVFILSDEVPFPRSSKRADVNKLKLIFKWKYPES